MRRKIKPTLQFFSFFFLSGEKSFRLRIFMDKIWQECFRYPTSLNYDKRLLHWSRYLKTQAKDFKKKLILHFYFLFFIFFNSTFLWFCFFMWMLLLDPWLAMSSTDPINRLFNQECTSISFNIKNTSPSENFNKKQVTLTFSNHLQKLI
jgi:hypothetical protein